MINRLLMSFLVCLLTARTESAELAIVTAEHAYLLNSEQEVVAVAPFFEVLTVVGSDQQFLQVEHQNQTLNLSPAYVHRTSQLSYVNDENFDTVHAVLVSLRDAARKADEELYNEAIALTQKAQRELAAKFQQPTTLHAWVRQYEAYLNCNLQNFEQAHVLLDHCDSILEELSQTGHFHAADVANVRGIAFDGEGEVADAIEAYERALLIAMTELGTAHLDTATIMQNLGTTLEADGDMGRAVFVQKMSRAIALKVLPASAMERITHEERLAELFRLDEQYDAALEHYHAALELYERHHSDELLAIADALTNVVYCNTWNEQYAAAEEACDKTLQLLDRMEPEDANYYRRDILNRLGTIDFQQQDYQAALSHYQNAAALTDPDAFEFVDGESQESMARALIELEETSQATQAFERAISIYAEVMGSDSEEVLLLREEIGDIISHRDGSMNDIVQVAMPRGYIVDEDGNIMGTVPGLGVLEWYSSNDDFHEVALDGKVGRLYNSQLHNKRLLPGYGVTKADVFRNLMQNISECLVSLERGNTDDARLALTTALAVCEQEPGRDNSLYLWLKIVEAGVQLRTEGPQAAANSLVELSVDIDEIPADAFPILIDYKNALATTYLELGDAETAARLNREARDLAIERYGEFHAVVLQNTRTLAKTLFGAGEHEDSVEEFRMALEISEEIYPSGAPEISEVISELSLALSQSGRLEEAAELLEAVLDGDQKLPKEIHATLVATLGRTYASLGKIKDARELLSAVAEVLTKAGEDAVASEPGLLAFSELGKLDIKEERWQEAADNLQTALKGAVKLDAANSFDAAELHRNRAIALKGLSKLDQAATELTEVLRIYEGLGGGDSPQAEQIRGELRSMSAAPTAERDDVSAQAAFLQRHFDLTPPGEAMYITNSECPVFATSEESDQQIALMENNTSVWSLEAVNGRHRIYLPDEGKFGWIRESDLTNGRQHLIEKGQAKLKKELKKKPAAFEECLAAFDRAQSVDVDSAVPAAIEVTEVALATIRSHYAFSNPLSALLYEDLLVLYQQAGQNQKLATTADEALTHFIFAHGFDHPETAVVRSLLANHNRTLGRFSKEDSELSEILKACEKRFGPQDIRTKTQRIGLAANLVRRGLFDDATTIYEDILTAEDDADTSFLRAAANMGLGGLLASKGNHNQASSHLKKAADDFDKLGTPVASLQAQTLVIQAYCAGQNGEYSNALELLARAEQIPLGPAEHSLHLSILNWKTRLAAKDFQDDAVALAEQAVQFANEAFHANNFLAFDALQAAGFARMFSKDSAAADSFDAARHLAHTYVSQNVAFQQTARQISYFGSDAKLLEESLTLGLISPSPAVAEQTATWLINSHNLLPETLARPRMAQAIASNIDELQTIKDWQGPRRQQADLPVKLQTSALPPFLAEAIEEINGEETNTRGNLSAEAQKVLLPDTPWIELDDVRSRLLKDEVLVMFRRVVGFTALANPFVDQSNKDTAEASYAAWIVPPTGRGNVEIIPIGSAVQVEAEIDRTLSLLRDIAKQLPKRASLRTALKEEQQRLGDLSDMLWARIEVSLPDNTSRLTFCLDGDLQQVPWNALPDLDGQPLLQSYTIRHLCSARELLEASTTALTRSAPVMITRPEALGQDTELTELPREELEFLNRRTRGSTLRLDKKELRNATGALGDLAGELFDIIAERRNGTSSAKEDAAKDAQLQSAFAKAFGDGSKTFTGVLASEYRYFAAVRPEALHIGAVNFANAPQTVEFTGEFASSESRVLIPLAQTSQFDPLMQCGLMLAGCGIDSANHHLNDGVLTGEEIVSQDLRGTQVVTLSVSPKSISRQPVENQALDILPHAFRLAGARTVLSSRWPVPSDVADRLIIEFYNAIAEGRPPADALRAAQLTLQKDRADGVPAAICSSFRIHGHAWTSQADATAAAESGGSSAGDADKLRTLAKQILAVYASKDIRKLLTFTGAGDPSPELLEKFAPGTSRYDSLFGESSWRWQAVSGWDGKLPAVYYTKNRKPVGRENADTAHVEFGRSGSEVFVVTLKNDDGKWTFDDIHSPDASSLSR